VELAVLNAGELQHEVRIAAQADEAEAVADAVPGGRRIPAERSERDAPLPARLPDALDGLQEARLGAPEHGWISERQVEVVGPDEAQVDALHVEDLVHVLDGFERLDLHAEEDFAVDALDILGPRYAEPEMGRETARAALALGGKARVAYGRADLFGILDHR
jgi:hypothetical protein